METKKESSSRRTLLIAAAAIAFVCIVCGVIALIGALASSSDDVASATLAPTAPPAGAEPSDVAEQLPADTVAPTATPQPTNTPGPTDTPRPTNTPLPTNTPRPTNTPTPPPEPILLTGSGDTVVDVDRGNYAAIAHITGNAAANHFAVVNYGSDGDQIDLLVNTTEPYDGIKPLDFRESEHTTRLEVTATGDWTIEILPLIEARGFLVPGRIEGVGDDVVILTDGTPDIATITGNAAASHFAVIGYGTTADLLVNTTEPYEGTVILDPDTAVLEITGVGPWSIEVTVR